MTTEPYENTVDYSTERRFVNRMLLISPAIAAVLVPVIHRWLLTILYLKQPTQQWSFTAAYSSPICLAAAACLPLFLVVWRLGIWIQPQLDRSRIPWAALITLLAIPACCVPFANTRLTWFFVEWALPRTPNPSFARNTLMWEQRNFETTGAASGSRTIGLVGSSQMNQGADLKMLAEAFPEDRFRKNCLAGFGPMQYSFLQNRLSENSFDTILCHLSEFDFFREDSVPVSRLRWASDSNGIRRLWTALSPEDRWNNRGELADLWFAAQLPLWRHRDHFRRVFSDYWWKTTNTAAGSDTAERLADAPALQEAIGFLRLNVGQRKLVETNFRMFEQFADSCQQKDVRLIVVEGLVHPEARAAYDDGARMQTMTRDRLSAMAEKFRFTWIPQNALPEFVAADFADAYHLNESGRSKFTQFLVTQLSLEQK